MSMMPKDIVLSVSGLPLSVESIFLHAILFD